MSWIPINDFPGDQQYDSIPGTEHASYWGQIGTNCRYPGESSPAWSWDDHGPRRRLQPVGSRRGQCRQRSRGQGNRRGLDTTGCWGQLVAESRAISLSRGQFRFGVSLGKQLSKAPRLPLTRTFRMCR